MSKKSFQKIKLLKLWEILNKESDIYYPLDTYSILSKLSEVGINCDRKTLYSDINELNKNGYKIIVKRSKRNLYYTDNSDFNLPELRILVDAVEAAKFITETKTDELVEKIATLGRNCDKDALRNGVYFDTQKYSNEAIYNNIVSLDTAIYNNKKVSFSRH